MEIKNKEKLKIFSIFFVLFSVLTGSLVLFYSQVISDYDEMTYRFSNLFADYEAITDDVGTPVANPDIPTISQVNTWLRFDDTNDALFQEDVYMCGDFAAELTVSAKEMNWRIRVIIMYFSYNGDVGYGVSDMFGEYGHAFNMIVCQDGDDVDTELDVWYIEPQSDGIWNLDYDHYDTYAYYFGGLTFTIWSETYWINYYTYIG